MDFGTKPSPGGQVAIVSAALHPAAEPAGCDQDGAPSSMDLTDDGENGRLAPFTYPRRASSADTSRNERWCPFGDRRRKRFASRTKSGLTSTWLLRPSHLPVARFRSRAARSLETRRHFSYCANEPAIWRILALIKRGVRVLTAGG